MSRSTQLFRYSLLALAATGLAACSDDSGGTIATPPVATTPTPAPVPPAPPPAPPAVTPDTFALTSGNKLVGFAAAAPASTVTVNLAVPAAETLLGGDFRPADGAMYVVTRVTASNEVKVYTANTSTGALGTAIALVNNGMGAGGGTAGAAVTLTGSKVGVDFNPVANALRIVDNTGANLRTGLGSGNNTFVDAPIAANLTESAYTNTFATTCQTDLYHLNTTQLLISAVPNGVANNPAAGARFVGPLGVTADANAGFDIRTTATGNVFTAALKVGGSYSLFTIDPATGAATSAGAIGGLGTENVLGLVANLPATAPANAPGNLLAITSGGSAQSLVTFNRPPQGSPGRLCSTTAISGLTAGDVIVGADTRPATGALTVLAKNGTAGALYTVAADGTASARLPLTVSGGAAVNLTANNFAVDYNPVPDRLRVIGGDGQNLRINPADGVTIVDAALNSGSGAAFTGTVSEGAYTNSLAGGGGSSLFTTLFGLDSTSNMLVRVGSDPAVGLPAGTTCATATAAQAAGDPNCGVVANVAPVTLNGAALSLANAVSFEINGSNGQASFVTVSGGVRTLFTLNLVTGAATQVGAFGTVGSDLIALTTSGRQTATVFGVTAMSNRLVSFAPSAPGTVTTLGTITVGDGEVVQGLDFRPSIGPKNGVLTALTTAANGTARLYSVNPANGAATAIATLAANPADGTAPYGTVGGVNLGIDFNPLPDALRTVSNTGENLRSNPDNGLTFTDMTLDTLNAFGAAYSNNFTAATGTELFYLVDAAGANTVLRKNMGNPNDGLTQPVGDTGTDFSAVGDHDIAGGNNGFSLAALQPGAGGASTLFRINLGTGALTSVGAIAAPDGEALRGLTVRLQ